MLPNKEIASIQSIQSVQAPIRRIPLDNPSSEAMEEAMDQPETRTQLERAIPIEYPVAIHYNGVPHVVMMTSPGDLIDFAYGFSLSEGVIDSARQIRAVQIVQSNKGVILEIELSGNTLRRHLYRRRNLTGRTGCGVCGVEKVEDLLQAKPLQGGFAPVPAVTALQAALSGLEAKQSLNLLTRAVHAAAWCNSEGKIIVVREDVGRHNALDKLIGAILRQNFTVLEGFAVITSRCSFEMVEKAVRSAMPVLVAVSAPTSLAVERAKSLGLTLLAVARCDSALLFTSPHEKAPTKDKSRERS